MREDSKVREPLWQRCEGRKKCERIGCFTVSRVALTAVCTPVGLGVCFMPSRRWTARRVWSTWRSRGGWRMRGRLRRATTARCSRRSARCGSGWYSERRQLAVHMVPGARWYLRQPRGGCCGESVSLWAGNGAQAPRAAVRCGCAAGGAVLLRCGHGEQPAQHGASAGATRHGARDELAGAEQALLGA